MSVTSILDRCAAQAPNGWNRTGNMSLLSLAQEAQDELLSAGNSSFTWIGTENRGFPPYLSTVAGTYRYEIVVANLVGVTAITKSIGGTDHIVRCLKPLRVFVDAGQSYDLNRRWAGEMAVPGFFNRFTTSTDRIQVIEIPIRKYEALENTNAYIEFLEDPGTHTDRYFIEFQWEAPRLDSELIPLVIPQRFEAAIEDYIMGKVELHENGSYGERMGRFDNGWQSGSGWMPSWRDQFQAALSSSASPSSGTTVALF